MCFGFRLKATVVLGANPPVSSPTLVLTKLSAASPPRSSALLTMMYAVTPQKKRVIMSTHLVRGRGGGRGKGRGRTRD